ncbi:MAG: WD40 repeat domain-containing protein, partial [bacterium]
SQGDRILGILKETYNLPGKRSRHWVLLWDASTGVPLDTLEHDHSVKSAEFDRRGNRVLTHSPDGRVAQLWDARTGRRIGPQMHHTNENQPPIFSPNEDRILTIAGDILHLCHVDHSVSAHDSLKHDGFELKGIFTRTGTRLLTWSNQIKSRDGSGKIMGEASVRLWDVASARPVGKIMKHGSVSSAGLITVPEPAAVLGVAFDPSEKHILTWSNDKTARLWGAETGMQIGRSMQHGKTVNGACFDREAKRILTWGADSTVRLWDAESGKQIGPSLRHSASVLRATFDRQEQRIMAWSKDSNATIWDISVDLDFPHEARALEIQALTGTAYNSFNNTVQAIEAEELHSLHDRYFEIAREHYKICRYAMANRFRQLYPEKAAKIRQWPVSK